MTKTQISKIENYDDAKPIRIWLGNLAEYNKGELVGAWLSLPMDDADLEQSITQILGDDEEWQLNDFECDIPGFISKINQNSDPRELNEAAKNFESLSESEKDQISHLLNLGCRLEDAFEKYLDVIIYYGMQLADVAFELVSDGHFGDIPESVMAYIDYEKIGRDLLHSGYFYDVKTKNTYFFQD